MKHCIIVKFKEAVNYKSMLTEIEELFSHCKSIEGISDIKVIENCIKRANRYDLMIEIEMSPSSLEAYDNCEWHHIWKEKYGEYIEKKAIFDYDD